MMYTKRMSIFLIPLFILIAVAGCRSEQAAAPPSPAATALPATAAAAVVSEEPTAAPTAEPLAETPGADPPMDAGQTANAAADAATPDLIAVMNGQADALLVSTLGNLSYTGLFPDRSLQLTDGIGRYEEPDSNATPYVRLLDQVIASGDLDGDGATDAAALLEDHSAGSGTFLYLVVVLDVLGSPSQTEPLLLGDRVQAKKLAIAGSQITADLIAQGPGDELCCASWNVRRAYALQEEQIVQTSSEEISQVSLSNLDGTNWRLVTLAYEAEPALVGSGVTLQFSDGMVSGSAGCNAYQGEVTSGPAGLFSLVVGPLSASAGTCDEALMLQETAYLAHLSDAVSWWMDGGRLALTYPTADGGFDNLYFAATPEVVMD